MKQLPADLKRFAFVCSGTLAALTLAATASPVLASASTPANWAGPYAGLNLGLSSGDYNFHGSDVDIEQISGLPTNQAQVVIVPGLRLSTPGDHKRSTDFAGGGQVGWNSQHHTSVIGVELDLDGVSRSASTHSSFAVPMTALTNTATVGINRDARSDWAGSLRVRAGTAHGQALYYGTLGIAMAQVKVRDHDTYTINPGPGAEGSTFGPFPTFVNAKSQTHRLTGWTLGFGAQWALSDRASVGVEYRHTDYGSATFNLAGPGSADLSTAGAVLPQSARVGLTDDQINVRYSWRFGN